MNLEKGTRGQIDIGAIKDSIDENKKVPENPGRFTNKDSLGYEGGLGYLYKKGDKFGFKADSEEDDEPIVEMINVPDNASVTEDELKGLREIVRVGGGNYCIGDVGGKQSVVCTERWGMNYQEHRTADGWVTDWKNKRI